MSRITFIGDIACDKPLLKAARCSSGFDFSRVFRVGRVFEGSDLVIGNLETCFGGGSRFNHKPYHYNSPDSFCEAIRAAGIGMLCTANNHCTDEGVKGIQRTLDVLDAHQIEHTGTFRADNETRKYIIKEIDGVRIAVYSLTYSVNRTYEASTAKDLDRHVNMIGFHPKSFSAFAPVAMAQAYVKPRLSQWYHKLKSGTTIPVSIDRMETAVINQQWLENHASQLKKAREEADMLCVMLHIGGQFNEEPGTFAQYIVNWLCGLGADVIVAHHPHTVQKVERIGKTVVAWSLGGFCLSPSGEYLVHECLPEYSLALHIDFDRNGISLVSGSVLKGVEDRTHYLTVIPAEEARSGDRAEDEKAERELATIRRRIGREISCGGENDPISR